MKVMMSSFLAGQKETVKELVQLLSKDYAYVSVLGTDCTGKQYGVQKMGISVNDSMWAERGFVVRVYNGMNYSEFSFNEISRESLKDIAEEIHIRLDQSLKSLQETSITCNQYDLIEEENIKRSFYGEVGTLPEEVSDEDIINKLIAVKEKGLAANEFIIDFRVSYENVQVSKIFVSNKKELEQAYIWGQGALVAIVKRQNNIRNSYKSFGGLKAVELLDEMEAGIEEVVSSALGVLDAKPVKPGVYDVICSPAITGLIAHEAFGHGVEMDMFVKKRAKAMEYIGKPIASELVTMHDGAASINNVSSYLFDDEGTLGADTIIIDKGILKTGISDLLSAFKLGTIPTGNGKRQSFERKAYTRMTNTIFEKGENTLEQMIASIDNGYLLDIAMSGMEDPKNWGIQCMILEGKEIKEGKLTGNIVSPVIMTGYVPDVLKSISMVSKDQQFFGSGACGKGYKEFVKVSDGGPYIKARVRLG